MYIMAVMLLATHLTAIPIMNMWRFPSFEIYTLYEFMFPEIVDMLYPFVLRLRKTLHDDHNKY